MVSSEEKKKEVLNNHHPIIYFLIVLLKYDESKQTKSYKLLNKYFEENNIRTSDEDNSIDGEIKENKINEINEKLGNINIDGNDNSKNKRIKTDIIDIIYSCIDEYGERVVNMARLMTIKKYFSKAVINSKIISKIFIVLNLGYLVFSDNEWYKFSYARNGWEKLSIYNLAKEVNLHLVNELKELCLEYHYSLEGLTNKILSFLNKNSITHNNLDQFETFFYTENFIYRMDKNYVLRFEDCVYDFNKKASRPGRPSDFCLKSTNYKYYSEHRGKIAEVKQFLKDIFVEDELIKYVVKILASTLTLGNKLRSIVFFIGSGRNGKTTFTNMLRLALGDYAATPNVSLFLGKSVTADKPSPHMIDLNNSRVAICEEPDGRSINITGDTKAITGNVGYIKSRSLYKDLQTVYVDLLPIINTNDKLTISNLDNALIDRILVIPFTQRFVNKMNISILTSTQNINNPSVKHANPTWQGPKIQAYAEALIHLLIQNYQEDYTTLEIPSMVIEATKSFIMRSDHIARFLEKDITDENDNYAISIDECYSRYKAWYKQYVSNRSINYSLEDFRMDLLKYSIRIKNVPSSDSNRMVESIIGYRFNN